MRPSFWEPQSPPSLPHSRPDGFKFTDAQDGDTRPTANIHRVYSGGVSTRLAGIDTVVVLCRIAAAVLGLVVKSFLEMIHASLTARTEHKKDFFRNRSKSHIKQGLSSLTHDQPQLCSRLFCFGNVFRRVCFSGLAD